MKEHKDYEMTLPEDAKNDQAWHIRILTGDFVETVIVFGNIAIDGEKEALTFNFDIVQTPDPDLTIDNVDLQLTAGDILEDVLDNAIQDDALVMKERNE